MSLSGGRTATMEGSHDQSTTQQGSHSNTEVLVSKLTCYCQLLWLQYQEGLSSQKGVSSLILFLKFLLMVV